LRAFESHHFLPGFHIEKEYYEIYEDDENNLIVLSFGGNARIGDEGFELDDEEVGELVERLKEI